MTTFINYLIEANLALLVVLAMYQLLLSRETNFRLMRFFLLSGMVMSVVFPLIHVGNQVITPPLGEAIPAQWLPEVVIEERNPASEPYDIWTIVAWTYLAGTFISITVLAIRISGLIKFIRNAHSYSHQQYTIIESDESMPAFSFFHVIYLGRANELADAEKQQIIRHETVHAQQLHSVDILLINIIGVFFWFNPCIRIYKKVFTLLHEFEADARAVENSDVNNYCSLLARVALESAGLTIANHFNNSLTVKRIDMIKKIKTTIHGWKLATAAAIIPVLFLAISCQDQIMADLKEIEKDATMVMDVPQDVQEKMDAITQSNPTKKYRIVEVTSDGSKRKITQLTEPGSKAVITNLQVVESMEKSAGGYKRSFVIFQQIEQTMAFTKHETAPDEKGNTDQVYTVVDDMPSFPGGITALQEFIRKNLHYDDEARARGAQGAVYVGFIIDEQGAITKVNPVKGVDPALDAEAMRVIQIMPHWIPGKQDEKPVKVKFILPIKFSLKAAAPAPEIQNAVR